MEKCPLIIKTRYDRLNITAATARCGQCQLLWSVVFRWSLKGVSNFRVIKTKPRPLHELLVIFTLFGGL